MADSIEAGHWWLRYSSTLQTEINSQNFSSDMAVLKNLFSLWEYNGFRDTLSSDQRKTFDFERSMLSNFDVKEMTKNLKFADSVVNAWLQKIENISLNVFLGFNNSHHLENFVMNHSGYPEYKDSKVVAGKNPLFGNW